LNFPVKYHPSKHENFAYGATCFVPIIGFLKTYFIRNFLKYKSE